MDGSTQFEHIAGNVNFLSTFSIVPEMMAVGAVHQLSGDSAYEDKVDWGQSILEKGVEVFGQSEILWDSLATVYSMNDNYEDALRASNNALRLAREHQSKYISEIEAQNSDLKKQTER
ncbi:hypothetical protein LG288_11200 [Idiomarina seosinensis]|uniref:hypothetical protein n=1 Tax=Idiomarina seosinensis TaxID=281739 RepID=UPI00384D249F